MSVPLLCFVEDSPDVGVIVRHLARHAGYEAFVCADAAAAWEFLHPGTAPAGAVDGPPDRWPDVLFLDVNLPGISGLELHRRLQAEGGPAGALPVALFTHLSLGPEIVAALAVGVEMVLAKDLLGRLPEWRERVAEILAWRGGHPLLTSLNSSAPKESSFPVAESATRLNRALRHPTLQRSGREIEAALLHRAWTRAVGSGAVAPDGAGASARPHSGPLSGTAPSLFPSLDASEWELARWLAPDGLLLTSAPEQRAVASAFFPLLARCLTAQVEYLLGVAESAAIRAVLEPVWTSDP
jgi:CheY-like chemotaxis protein